MIKQTSKKEIMVLYGLVKAGNSFNMADYCDTMPDCKCAEWETRFTALKSEYDGIWGEKEWQRLRIKELEKKVIRYEAWNRNTQVKELLEENKDLRTALENHLKIIEEECKEKHSVNLNDKTIVDDYHTELTFTVGELRALKQALEVKK